MSEQSRNKPLHLYLLLLLTLIAFAANSVLNRFALLDQLIDPASFTLVRLCSGALTLIVIVFCVGKPRVFRPTQQHLLGGSFLFSYAVFFSYAYIVLDTATGALLLFGTVQIAILLFSLAKGRRLNTREWLGFVMAIAGFLWLTLPHFVRPSWAYGVMMILSGLAWAAYTLAGKSSQQPIIDTAINFIIASVIAMLLFVAYYFSTNGNDAHISVPGLALAVSSGAVASGLGYALWYTILPKLTDIQAATLQLSVPVIAGFFGVIFLAEALSLSLLLAAAFILTGIFLVITSRP